MKKFAVIRREGNLDAIFARIRKETVPGDVIEARSPTRNLEQNAKFHAICSDIARETLYAGRKLDVHQWKVLLISGHAVATKEGAEIVPGLEGEFVNIRESSAAMSKKRAASLIEYALAYCAQQGIKLSEHP